MRNLLTKLYVFITTLALLTTTSISAQTLTEGFETGLPTSGSSTAQNYTLASGVWTILKGASTSTSHSGSLGLKLSSGNTTPTYAIAPALNAVSTVSFWAKGSSTSTVTILKSVNGGAYTTVATQAITTTFTLYTINVNETGSNVRIEFENTTSQTLYIDDVTINYGSVTPVPALSVTPTSEAFGNTTVNTTSAEKTYSISGTNLSPASGSITITAPTGYQLTITSGSGYASSLSVSYTGSTLPATTIYVVLKPTAAQSYSGNITNAGGGATIQNVALTGTGTAAPSPTLTVTPTSEAFGNTTVNTTSAEKTYSISGSNLSPASGSITVTAPSGYQLTTTSGSGYASSLSVAYTGSSLVATTIYVVFKPTAAQSYTGNITNAGGGATTQNVALTGTGVAVPSPTLTATPTSEAFGNETVNTTSAEKTYSLSGANLSPANGSITVTAPTGYQLTTTSGSGYASSLSVAYTGSSLAATTIYVVFRPTAAQSYTGNITNAGGGATTQNVALTGTGVALTPTLNVSSTSLSSFGNITTGSSSASSNYTVAGTNLTANIIVTAPTGFQVSTDNSTFASSVTITQSGGTVASTKIYARFSPTSATGSTTGTITNTSTGATTQNVSVSGIALAAQPTTQGTISFGTVTSTSIVVSLPTVGNGTNRIIVAKSGSAVSTDPTDATAYTASATFGSGTQIGSGNYVVYNGTGSSVTVTGLTASTTYYFAVYEFNIGTGTSQNYLTPSAVTGNQATSKTVVTIPPAIAFDTVLTTHFINPPYVSGTISDPTDPASTDGIIVDITANGSGILAANYTLTAKSSKTSVVPTANIIITPGNGTANIKIIPAAVGYSNITLTMKSGSTSKTLVIDYAASAASSTPASTFWHTGYSDASAAIRLDSNYMVIGDDEFNDLFVSDRNHSGLPVKTFYFGDQVGFTDGSTGDYKEGDIEACTPSVAFPGRSYWTGSMSNGGSSDKYEPDRNTLFATNITGTGAATSISVVGHYNNMLTQLVTWGDANGYDLSSSSEAGHDPKTIDGFNVEGMAIGPDNTTLFIGFRAPLVPTANRTNALIAPLLNFETWFNNGKPSGNPTFGAPIELNLGGRGVRDIVRLSNGDYIIVAGSYEGSQMVGALFKWTGKATDAPVQLTNMDISSLNAEACVEMHVNGQLATNELQVISDNGSFVFYGDGTEAKDLTENNYEKYRSDIITATNTTFSLREADTVVQNTNDIKLFPNPVTDGSFRVETSLQGIKQVKVIDDKGAIYKQFEFNSSSTTVSTSGWAKGNYQLVFIASNGAVQTKSVIVLR